MDNSGSVVPETQVIAVQMATGLQLKAVSPSTEAYDVPELPGGRIERERVSELLANGRK
jgi:hypothetical protein